MATNDYLVLTALKREWDWTKPILAESWQSVQRDKRPTYYTCPHHVERAGTKPGEYLISAAWMAEYTGGQPRATGFADMCLEDWHPERIVLVGIAGSLKDTLKLGDVVFPNKIIGYVTGTADADGVHFRPKFHAAEFLDIDRVHAFRDSNEYYQAWRMECREAGKHLGLPIGDEGPTLHIETVASGNFVVRSQQHIDLLHKEVDQYIAAVEMEAEGLFEAVYLHGNEQKIQMIRGISDYADENKVALDRSTRNYWQQYATENAARFLRSLWNTRPFPPTSPRYDLNLKTGEPSRLRQHINTPNGSEQIRDIRHRGVGSQNLVFDSLLDRPGFPNPPIDIIARIKPADDQKNVDIRGLCVQHAPQVIQISGYAPNGNEIWFRVPASEHGLRIELLLSLQSKCSEISIECRDEFGRSTVRIVTFR